MSQLVHQHTTQNLEFICTSCFYIEYRSHISKILK